MSIRRAVLCALLSASACGKSDPTVAPATSTAPPATTVTAPAPTAATTEPAPTTAPADVVAPAEPDAEPATAPPAPPAPKAAGIALDGYCVVLGSAPLDAFERAERLATKAREAGFADARIFDARDFDTLTWGHLVVLAEVAPDDAAANERIKAAKAAKLSAFSKRCTSDAATPLVTAADVRPAYALPTDRFPAPEADDALPEGCFAWSTKLVRALCMTSSQSIQTGATLDLAIVPPDSAAAGAWPIVLDTHEPHTFDKELDDKLDAAEAKRVADELARGDYVELDLVLADWMRPIAPKAVLRWATPSVSVTRKRKVSTEVAEMAGSWQRFEETLEVRCGDKTFEWWTFTHYDDAPRALVGLVPDGKALILSWSESWTIEGDSGGSVAASVFDLAPCAAAPAPDAPDGGEPTPE